MNMNLSNICLINILVDDVCPHSVLNVEHGTINLTLIQECPVQVHVTCDTGYFIDWTSSQSFINCPMGIWPDPLACLPESK